MKLKKNILGLIVWRGLYFVTVFVLNVILSRFFLAEGSGWIYYITNYLSFIILILSLSLDSGITFFAAGNSINGNKLAAFALLWTLVVSLLVVLLFFLFYRRGAQFFTVQQIIFFSGIYTAGILLTAFFNALFYARQEFALPNIVLTVTNIFLIIAMLLLTIFNKHQNNRNLYLKLYFLNFFFQGMLISVLYLIKNKAFAGWSLPHPYELKRLFRYAVFALFANLVFFLVYRIDYWFVKNNCAVCNEQDLGNYIQVSKLGQLFLVFPSMIASMLFPRTAAGFNQEVNTLLPVLSRVLFFLYLILMLLLVLVGHWLFSFLFGATFDHMYVPFLLLIPGVLALSSLAFVSAYYAGQNRVVINLKASSLGLIVLVIGDTLFIPYFGIKSAALISSVAYTTCYFYVLLSFKKDYVIPLSNFFIPAGSDFKKVYHYIVRRFQEVNHS